MDVSPSDPRTWEYFDTRLKGAIAFAISDTGAMCVFNTHPIFAAYGGGPGIWRPSCNGKMVELQKQGTAPDFSGGGSLVIRKGFEALAEAQRRAHEQAVANRMPIPRAEDVVVPPPPEVKAVRKTKKAVPERSNLPKRPVGRTGRPVTLPRKVAKVVDLGLRQELINSMLLATLPKVVEATTDRELDTVIIDLSMELMRVVRPMNPRLSED